jgi:lipopolysaccharide/colanic/teichoic acid biosynthesis glycosyltransferase
LTKDQSGPAHVHVASSSTPIGGSRKRAFDVVVAFSCLVLLSPLLAAVACLLRLGQGAPVLARELTQGAGGRRFERLTFRVASHSAGAGRVEEKQQERVGLGDVLQKAGLTGLPQLVNVLRGEMSIVGPKPTPPNECCASGDDGVLRRARPGLIFSDGDGSSTSRVDYVKSWSFKRDLRMLWKAMTERRYTLFY